MFEDLWNGILELTSKFVIPDWGSVIAMLPVLIFALTILVILVLFWRIWRAPKARRGKVRVEPVAPAGVHMPGPSWAPPLAALGAFALFIGLVFPGPLLVIGAIILSLTLLYWLVEAVRIYDHDLGATAPALPVVVHEGPPPGVHMPGPSFLPFLAAVGMGMLFLGLVFGEWLLAVGVIGLIVTLVGWMTAARQEYVKTVEADSTGHLETIGDPKTPKLMLSGLVILLVAAFVVQVGWIPPRAAGSEASPGASGAPPPEGGGGGEPPASGEPGGSPGTGGAAGGGGLELHAKDIAFVETSLSAPADQPFDLHFFNDDASIPHDVAFKDSSGAEAFKGEVVTGVADTVYKVPPLPAGEYQYICTIHPNMTGTATLQ
jgi:Cupredoxin-like domain/Cytochrome c oxidase subunit IV